MATQIAFEPNMTAASSMKPTIKTEDDDWTMSNLCEVVMFDDSSPSKGTEKHGSDKQNGTVVVKNLNSAVDNYMCDTCNRDFLTLRELKSHQRMHNPDRPYACELCDKRFRQKGHRDDHMRTHTDERPFKCTYCDRTFRQRGDLNIHMRNHTGENLHQCTHCAKSFNRKSTLNTHLLTHTREKTYSCSYCEKTFNQRSLWYSHQDEHTMNKVTIPSTPLHTTPMVKRHTANHKNTRASAAELSNGVGDLSSGPVTVLALMDGTLVETEDLHDYFKTSHNVTSDLHSCVQCETSYVHKELLDLHVQTHLSAKRLSCSYCNKLFIQESVFKQHLTTHKNETFTCDLCQKSFSQKKYLLVHMKAHSEEPEISSHTCEICGQNFPNEDELIGHQEDHAGDKPHICPYCLKGFKQKQSLKNHVLSHTGKTNICPYCRAMIRNDDEFNVHVAKHTIDLPFVCHFCQKAFRKRPNLNMHLRTHTGEKPYKCKFCSKAFRLQPNLKCHLRVHTGEKPYICDYCGKGFAQQTAWKSHIQLHTGKKYECGYCCTAFAVRAHLKNHILLHHTNQQPYMCSLCSDRYDNEKQLLDHWQARMITGPFDKVGCGMYQLFMSILDRPIVSALGLQDRLLKDVLADFIQMAGRDISFGDTISPDAQLAHLFDEFMGVIVDVSGAKVDFDFKRHPIHIMTYEMLLILKNKMNYLQV